MRCPHYVDQDGGLCGIWRHRESVCTTWFCKYDRGAVGRVHWRIIASLLGVLELAVKLWAMRAAGLDEEAQVDLWSRIEWEKRGIRPPLDDLALANTVHAERYRKDWANFVGREEEFFLRCAELVGGLSWEDALRLGGAAAAAAVNAARFIQEKLAATELPERAITSGNVYLQIRKRGEVRVRHQGVPLDWLDVPEAIAREVPRFERGPAKAILAELRAEGVPIDDELVRRLLDWQVLVKP
jgi:hypothetical protein